MKFAERSYSGKLFRPRPETLVDNDGELIIIATPWGPRSSAKRAIRTIQDYFTSTRQDEEVTTPFARLANLSKLANDLRIAVKLANDAIYYEDNKREFISGVELFVLAKNGNEVVWAQVGHPYAILIKQHGSPISLSSQIDLSLEYSTARETLAPLPTKMLGLEVSSDFSVDSFRPSRGDQLLLISRSGMPYDILQMKNQLTNIEDVARTLSSHQPDLPFWIGNIQL